MPRIGELWLVDFGDPYPGEPAHHRPALVVGPAEMFSGLPFVFVVPTTTTHRGLALHVELEPGSDTGLDDVSYAQCEQLRSINARRLVHRLGAAPPAVQAQVDSLLRALLDH